MYDEQPEVRRMAAAYNEMRDQRDRLQAEVERLEGIIGDAVTVIDAAWGGPCGEALDDARTILGRA